MTHTPASTERRPGLLPRVAPCFVSHNMALGGAQTAVLRMIRALPDWLRDSTTLYVQSRDLALLDAAQRKHGFTVGKVTLDPPSDPSSWVLSYGKLDGLPTRPTSLLLHSWDDAGYRFISKAYAGLRGLRVAAVSRQVMDRYAAWVRDGGHEPLGVLPPPVSEFTSVKGASCGHRVVVGWMGRPLESKGLLALPHLLAMDPRLVVRAWTGADTSGHEATQKAQSNTLARVLELARALGVEDRLDLRPLDFDPFAYRHRLHGCHVFLGNSEKEGFLLTAAEALSCGVPVIVTRSCGVADLVDPGVNGELIDWRDDPRELASQAFEALPSALRCPPAACLASVAHLSLEAGYAAAHGELLSRLVDAPLAHPEPRVTVGVRIHQGVDTRCLDDAIHSVASQSYRRFKTVLLVDGPWEFGESLARRFGLPLICTGRAPDITHCSWLHRSAVERCDTEFYKPLDYDDQLLPGYLARAVEAADLMELDVYGCKLLTLQDGAITPRLHWPNKPLESMFTGNSDDNMLPHSSVLLRTRAVLRAGNYQERAVGLGADDYHLWYRMHLTGSRFFRNDEARHVVYRQHERNSLKLRRQRYGSSGQGRLITGAAAASFALLAGQSIQSVQADAIGPTKDKAGKSAQVSQAGPGAQRPDDLDPPHS